MKKGGKLTDFVGDISHLPEQLVRWMDGVQKFEVYNSFEYFNIVIDRGTTQHQLSTNYNSPPAI
jgi:hypothetical protein